MAESLSSPKACIVAMDMGGTNIKFGVTELDGTLLFADHFPANSALEKEKLLARLSLALERSFAYAALRDLYPIGIAISTPGPFNYAEAKSGMVGKYDSIFGVDLRQAFRERVHLPPDMPIRFMQDAAAYLMGEAAQGAGKGEKNCICVTLGTGVGYACMMDGQPLLNERKGPYYVLATQTYKGTEIEHLLSGRAIQRQYGRSAQELFEQAPNDPNARAAFEKTGQILGEALLEIPEIHRVSRIILGGQVANAYPFIHTTLREALHSGGIKAEVCRAKYLADAALIGAATHLFP